MSENSDFNFFCSEKRFFSTFVFYFSLSEFRSRIIPSIRWDWKRPISTHYLLSLCTLLLKYAHQKHWCGSSSPITFDALNTLIHTHTHEHTYDSLHHCQDSMAIDCSILACVSAVYSVTVYVCVWRMHWMHHYTHTQNVFYGKLRMFGCLYVCVFVTV